MSAKHAKFLARTILVQNNNVEKAYIALDRMLKNERIFSRARELMAFEKPTDKRKRWHYERCRRIYDFEMKKRISFLMQVNRKDPYPW